MPGLPRVLAALLIAWAALALVTSSALATVITSPTGTVATPTIKAESEGYVALDKEPADIECKSSIEGKVESHGPGITAMGVISSLSFTECKDLWHVTVATAGSLEVHWSSGYNGTITSSGLTVQATRQGVVCYYSTQNTHIGTITGGTPATIHLEASIPLHSGSNQFCGTSSSALTGSYKISTPTSLFIDKTLLGPSAVTAPTGVISTPSIKAKSEGNVVLHNPIASIGCSSEIEGTVENHESGPASGAVNSLSFTECTNSWHVTVLAAGTMALHATEGYDGTVTSSGLTIEATHSGAICRYRTEHTHLGTLTGGSPSTIHLEAQVPFHGGSGLCGEGTRTLTGSYAVRSPASLFVDRTPVVPEPGTSLTSPKGTVSTPSIKAESEGNVVLHNPIAKIECTSAMEGKVEGHGEGLPAYGKLTTLAFAGCKNSWHVTVALTGALDVHWSSGSNGTVVSSGATVEATRLGVLCRYSTEATDLGTLTGGTPATLDLAATVPFHGGSGLCGSSATGLTGSYAVTSPTSLFVDKAPVEDEPGTNLTSPTGTIATPSIEVESEGHVTLDHPIASIECQWAFNGSVGPHGEGEPVVVSLSSLVTSACTDSWHATTSAPGQMKVDWTSGYGGTVTWRGGTVEMTRSGTTCLYKADETHLGTITGGTPATVHIEAKLPLHGGGALCGEEAYSLTGSLQVTSPNSLFVDKAG